MHLLGRIQNLTSLEINIPNDFVVTISHIINSIDPKNIESLRRGGQQVRLLLENGRFPKEMSEVIIKSYEKLSSDYNQEFTDVA